jgi:hypothetical protein
MTNAVATQGLSLRTATDWARDRLASIFGKTHQGARDMYSQFGYPTIISSEMLQAMYLRNDIANRIIRAFPAATWREAPLIRDDAGDSAEPDAPSYSPFVESVDDFFSEKHVIAAIKRADRLSSIGRFGVMLLGFKDGLPFHTPLPKGHWPLQYMSSYADTNVTVSQWDMDKTSARYGKPVLYTLRQSNLPLEKTSQVTVALSVHWTRCIHIAEFLDADDVYGIPRLTPIYNRLMDLEKVMGSASETFWLNSRAGLVISADKETDFGPEEMTAMRAQSDEYEHQLRRVMAFRGMTVTQLQAEVADPGPLTEKLLDLIAGTVGMPKRILVGSERGELASDQDENNWSERILERRDTFATPQIIVPLVDRLIATGNIIEPEGDYWVEWSKAAMSETKRAELGTKKTQMIQQYLSTPGAEFIVPVPEFRTDFLGMDPESDFAMPEEIPLPEEEPVAEDIPVEEPANDDQEVAEESVVPFRPKTKSLKQKRHGDPDQPRDEGGQWTDGGGTSDGPSQTEEGGDGDGGVPDDALSGGDAGGHARTERVVAGHTLLHEKTMKTPMTNDERGAFQAYAGAGYADINESLRAGKKPAGSQTALEISQMDAAFSRAALPQTVTAYRTVDQEIYDQMVAGSTFTDMAFTSVSTDPKFEMDAMEREVQRVKIKIPKGSKAIPMAAISSVPEEAELLINRGARFKVGRVGKDIVLTLEHTGDPTVAAAKKKRSKKK